MHSVDALFWLRDCSQLKTAGVLQVLVETVVSSYKAVRTRGRLVGTINSCYHVGLGAVQPKQPNQRS